MDTWAGAQYIVKIFHQHISHIRWTRGQEPRPSVTVLADSWSRRSWLLWESFFVKLFNNCFFVEVKYYSGLYHCYKKLCSLLPQDGGGSPDTFPACDGSINKSFFPHLIVNFILFSVYLFLFSNFYIAYWLCLFCTLSTLGGWGSLTGPMRAPG